jgi:hypothetical protein
MTKIQESVNDNTRFFNVNGLDYPKNQYIYKYRNEVVNDGNVDTTVIEIAIVDKYTGELLISYSRVEDYVNAFDVEYTSIETLLADLSILLGFNWGGTAPTGDLSTFNSLSSNTFNHLNNPKPILSAGVWDANIREIGNILRISDTQLALVYTGTLIPYTEGVNEYIGLATSNDNGLTWTKGGALGDGKITSTNSEDPYLVKNPANGLYHLYAERKVVAGTKHDGIELWTSSDLINFTSQGIVLQKDVLIPSETQDVSSPTVMIENNIWYLFYEGRSNPSNGGSVALAISSDGITFTKQTPNPLIYGMQWDTIAPKVSWATHLVPDDIIKIDNDYYLTAHAYNGVIFATGLFTSTDLLNWTDVLGTWVTKYDNNDSLGDGLMFFNDGFGNFKGLIKSSSTQLAIVDLTYNPYQKELFTARTTATGISNMISGNRSETVYANITADRTFTMSKNYISNSGVVKTIINNSAFVLTITPATDVLFNGLSTSIVLQANEIVTLVCTGINTWNFYTLSQAIPSAQTLTQRSTLTSGTETIANTSRNTVLIHEAGATTALTVNLPATPVNNQTVNMMSVGGIVGLTVATPVGSIVGNITTLPALGNARFMWVNSQNKWYKI